MNTHTVKEETPKNSNNAGQVSFLTLPDGRRVAYVLSEGALPGVVFLGGFRSDMTGTKATFLEAHCRKLGRRFLRFDYTGHGQSSGSFTDGTIGQWKQDTIDIIDNIAPGKNIFVGSSMGGWIMLLAALARKDKVAGLVGIASAPDFTQSLVDKELSDSQRRQLMENGVVHIPSCYGEPPFAITRQLIEDGRNQLLLGAEIPLNIPVRLIHGMLDEDVSWQVSAQLAERLTSADVTLNLVKNGGHRLSEPDQLALITSALDDVLKHT